MPPLPWPSELPLPPHAPHTVFTVPGSNVVLDLHGDPSDPDLTLFMAGNQYRALPDLIAAFRHQAADAQIFYATLPPGRLIDAMESGELRVGNLALPIAPDRIWPDVFMTGPKEHARLKRMGLVDEPRTYARTRGAVLLVRTGNPKSVRAVEDLLRDDVRVAISSPERERASFESYSATLAAQGGSGLIDRLMAKPSTISPAYVHHREVPQLLADGLADAAPMYFHFGEYLARAFPETFAYVPLPDDGNRIDELAAAPLRSARHPDLARAWCAFLYSTEAAAIFARHDFKPVASAGRNA